MVKTDKVTQTETIDETVSTVIRNPLFVVFAEFLGYESPIISWAEEICQGKHVSPFKRNLVNLDAVSIFNKMQKDYTIKEIKEWWDSFYPIILVEYDNRLKNLEFDDLPF
jgi:hypothetical protein